jgi:hypothetical protein
MKFDLVADVNTIICRHQQRTVTVDLLLYKTISYIPFGQDKAVTKTGNASIQVTHIVWDSIPKFRSNRSLLMSTYDFIYTCYKIKFH